MEKLEKYGVDFIAGYLGNKENKEIFFAGQSQTYPDVNTWVMDSSEYQAIIKKLELSGNELRDMLNVKNEAAVLKQELAALLVENKYFMTYHNETNERITPYRSIYRKNSAAILALWLDYQNLIKNNNLVSLTYKLKNLLFLRYL